MGKTKKVQRKLRQTKTKTILEKYGKQIKTTKEKLWDALTNPEMTSQYYFGSRIKSDLKKGSSIEYIIKDDEGKETAPVSGVIEEIIPYKRLVHTFDYHDFEETPSRVTFNIE